MQELEFLTTVELLKLLKDKYDNCSDYRLAKVLGVTPQAVSLWQQGKSIMNDEAALKVAKELDISPALAVLSVMRERTKNPEIRDIIDTLPTRALRAVCFVLLGFSLSFLHLPGVIN